ncbi:MAG: NAD(P)/FAD-dependent oxidoreductase [Bacteroidetes bacterium]|nr:MAG: NAD(P)/FAD-dependent oxidoreductase [Bacteroidota bacterium]
MRRKHVVIIGNGVGGITTARFVRKWSDHRITVISDESDYFFSRTALMYIYMGHLTFEQTKPYEDDFWAKNRIERVRDYVVFVDVTEKVLRMRSGNDLHYDTLVLATGSKSNRFGWPGQDLDGVQGLYSLQDLERMERNTRGIERAVVVGGGLIGVEMAEMLSSRGIAVTFLVREQGYMDHILPPEESRMVGRQIVRHGVDLRLGTELKEILPGETGRVRAVVTKQGEEIPCDFVGLTVGVHPNLDVTQGSGIATNRGILVNEYFETNVPEVYAVGDCAEFRQPLPGRRPVEQLWYTARAHGKTVARTICGERTPYRPDVFFNSAKFFDLEYQVYGEIEPDPGEEVATLFWQHPEGDKSIRINYRKEDHRVVGFNLMGVRYRHAVCAEWVRRGRDMAYVLSHLERANFDPEFYSRYEAELLRMYNARHPERAVQRNRKRGLWPLRRA